MHYAADYYHDSEAERCLGDFYCGDLVKLRGPAAAPLNFQLATYYYEKAVQQGNIDAMLGLGIMYSEHSEDSAQVSSGVSLLLARV